MVKPYTSGYYDRHMYLPPFKCLARVTLSVLVFRHINSFWINQCWSQPSFFSKLLLEAFTPIHSQYLHTHTHTHTHWHTHTHTHTHIYIYRRCPWCNGYRRRNWTRQYEFKSRTRLIAFHIALIPFEKVWIQLFSLQIRINSRTD